MFLQVPADNDANSRIYKSDQEQLGFVMNLSRLWAWRPEVYEAFGALRSLLMTGSSLSSRELAVMVCATAAELRCAYCALAWGTRFAKVADAATAAAVLQGAQCDALTARDRALSVWARKAVRDPNGTTAEDVEALRAAGLSDKEIFEATAFVAFRVAFSTINDALGARPDWQLAANAPPEVVGAVTFGRRTAERVES